jgi:DNA-binding NarL/FixJ family response regulator
VITVLLATDADWIFDEVDAALADTSTSVLRVRTGIEVVPACRELEPDLVVIDLQIGNMGGMAASIAIHQEQDAGRLSEAPVLMLLDRAPDVFLAQRSDAEGWLVKPLDAFRLRRAAQALLGGGTFTEGLPAAPAAEHNDLSPTDGDNASGSETTGEGDGGSAGEAGGTPAAEDAGVGA